jgi:hypothetical protein
VAASLTASTAASFSVESTNAFNLTASAFMPSSTPTT